MVIKDKSSNKSVTKTQSSNHDTDFLPEQKSLNPLVLHNKLRINSSLHLTATCSTYSAVGINILNEKIKRVPVATAYLWQVPSTEATSFSGGSQ